MPFRAFCFLNVYRPAGTGAITTAPGLNALSGILFFKLKFRILTFPILLILCLNALSGILFFKLVERSLSVTPVNVLMPFRAFCFLNIIPMDLGELIWDGLNALSGILFFEGRRGTDPYNFFTNTGRRGRRPLQMPFRAFCFLNGVRLTSQT